MPAQGERAGPCPASGAGPRPAAVRARPCAAEAWRGRHSSCSNPGLNCSPGLRRAGLRSASRFALQSCAAPMGASANIDQAAAGRPQSKAAPARGAAFCCQAPACAAPRRGSLERTAFFLFKSGLELSARPPPRGTARAWRHLPSPIAKAAAGRPPRLFPAMMKIRYFY